jgi:hypothetical protein
MKFRLKANPSSDQGGTIPAGAVSFTVPLHLFEAWNGSGVDTLDPSAQVPQAPATSNSVYFNYTIDEENNQLIIKNSRDINGSVQFETEFGWKVNVLDVPGGHPKTENADVSGDDWWKDYEGHKYPMFVMEAVRLLSKDKMRRTITGTWSAEKRGANYGIRLVASAE